MRMCKLKISLTDFLAATVQPVRLRVRAAVVVLCWKHAKVRRLLGKALCRKARGQHVGSHLGRTSLSLVVHPTGAATRDECVGAVLPRTAGEIRRERGHDVRRGIGRLGGVGAEHGQMRLSKNRL